MPSDGPLSLLDLAMFEMRVQALETEALQLAGQPGGGKAHKRAIRARRAYRLSEAATRMAGNRLNNSSDLTGQPILNPEFRRFKK